MTSAVFEHVDDVAYVRRGVTSRAYGKSIPPSGEIFPPNDVMVVRVRVYVRREYKGIFMFLE
jgi:hypothetical protein